MSIPLFCFASIDAGEMNGGLVQYHCFSIFMFIQSFFRYALLSSTGLLRLRSVNCPCFHGTTGCQRRAICGGNVSLIQRGRRDGVRLPSSPNHHHSPSMRSVTTPHPNLCPHPFATSTANHPFLQQGSLILFRYPFSIHHASNVPELGRSARLELFQPVHPCVECSQPRTHEPHGNTAHSK